jgi:hypothetical protein
MGWTALLADIDRLLGGSCPGPSFIVDPASRAERLAVAMPKNVV